MSHVRRVAAFVAAAALCFTIGCRMPGSKSVEIRYWVLETLPGEVQPSENPRVVGVGPVELPAYLQRNEVVSRSGANELVVSPVDLWGSPLEEGVPAVLGRNIALLVPGTSAVAFPWKGPNQPSIRVAVSVQRFEVTDGRSARLDAIWGVVRVSDGRTLGHGAFSAEEAVQGKGTTAEVSALSRLLASLSREVAKPISGRG